MNCPDCNGESKVIKTIIGVGVRQRYRNCQSCGTRWVSEERNLKVRWGSSVARNQPATDSQPPPTTGNHPPTVANGWGVGGDLSSGSDPYPDPISRSGSYSDRDPDPRARFKYPDSFEAVWAGTGGKGGKKAAFTAWKKAGSPPWGELAATWGAYMLSERVARGYLKDLSGWFNAGYHQQTWVPYEPKLRAVAGWRSSTGDDM